MADWNKIKEDEVKYAIEQAEKRANRDIDIVKWLHEHKTDERIEVRLQAIRFDSERSVLIGMHREILEKIDALNDEIELCEIELATKAD